MKLYLLPLGILICFACCKSNSSKHAIDGNWVALEIKPTDRPTLDSEKDFGMIIANLTLSKNPDTSIFRSDSLYSDKELKAVYQVEDNDIRFKLIPGNDSLHCTYKMNKDTLWLIGAPTKGFTTVYKKV